MHQYLRHICTQLEACPNLISIKHIDNHCPDKCHILTNTFGKRKKKFILVICLYCIFS